MHTPLEQQHEIINALFFSVTSGFAVAFVILICNSFIAPYRIWKEQKENISRLDQQEKLTIRAREIERALTDILIKYKNIGTEGYSLSEWKDDLKNTVTSNFPTNTQVLGIMNDEIYSPSLNGMILSEGARKNMENITGKYSRTIDLNIEAVREYIFLHWLLENHVFPHSRFRI